MTASSSSRSTRARKALSASPAALPAAPWSVMQRIDLPDAKAANAQILDDLSNGANGLMLVFEGAVGDYGYALPATEEAIAEALDSVHLDAGIALELDFGPPSRHAAEHRWPTCQGEGS